MDNPTYRYFVVTRDGKPQHVFICPECGCQGDVDDEQFFGQVSIICPECKFHESVDLDKNGKLIPLRYARWLRFRWNRQAVVSQSGDGS